MLELSRHLPRIRAVRPGLEIRTVREDPDGVANDVVIVNEEWVFRFPVSQWGRQILEREERILELVRDRLEVRVPRYEERLHDLAVYRLIPGEPLSRRSLLLQDEEVQERLARQIGGFLRALHTLPPEDREAARIPESESVRTSEQWEGLYHDLERDVLPLLPAYGQEHLREHFRPLLEGRLSLSFTPALVHGDLGHRHLLYDPEKRELRGVLDWGSAGLGDPAHDLGVIIHTLGESFLRRMVPHYPEIPDHIDRARFMAGAVEALWALNGLRSKRPQWLLYHLGTARDMRPIGSPW